MTIQNILRVAAACVLLAAGAARAQSDHKPTAQEKAEYAKLQAIYDSENRRTGDIMVPGADATLHLGKAYYFLDAADARKVIVDAWGNLPDQAENVLGMVFPAGKNFSNSWGAVVTWHADGWVDDKDAASANYGSVLKQMQDGEEQDNAQRKKQGLKEVHLVGWAQSPTYDAATHSAIWARQLHEDGRVDGLNYDVRLLGRRGVLSLNMVADMPELPQVRAAAKDLARTAAFDPGARYADYKPGVDKSAGYGIAGLVAGGVALAVAKKLGFLGLILVFAKKFFVFILAGLAGVGAWFRRQWARLRGKPVPPRKPKPAPVAAALDGPDPSHQFGGQPPAAPSTDVDPTGTV
jgi:uncharacterized membrane-anchored protein